MAKLLSKNTMICNQYFGIKSIEGNNSCKNLIGQLDKDIT